MKSFLQVYYQQILFFIFISGIIVFRIQIEKYQYITPDSIEYLTAARNLLQGNGAKSTSGTFFSYWPLAYPSLIALTSKITHIEVIWASKILNLFLLGISIILINILFNKNTNLPVFYFGSYSLLEIYSHTWSECLSTPLLLLYIYTIIQISKNGSNWILTSLLIISLFGLNLTRYSSFIYLVINLIFTIYFWNKIDNKTNKHFFISTTLSTFLVLAYLTFNYFQVGHPTGHPRSVVFPTEVNTIIQKFIFETSNLLFIAKKINFLTLIDSILFIIINGVQAILCYLTFKNIKIKINQKLKIILIITFIYFGFVFFTHFIIHKVSFDDRILVGFSAPIYFYLLHICETQLIENNKIKLLNYIKVFLFFSAIFNLPKQYLIDLLF